jgi:hypothetical protein
LRDFKEEKQSFSSSKSLKKNIIGWEKRTKDFLHSPISCESGVKKRETGCCFEKFETNWNHQPAIGRVF